MKKNKKQFKRGIDVLSKDEAFEVINPDDLQEKFKQLKSEDVKFYTQTTKILEDSGVIGVNKYSHLIDKRSQFNNWNALNPDAIPKQLTELENNQILQYETDKLISNKEKQAKSIEYLHSVRSTDKKTIETIVGIEFNKSTLYHGFMQAFKTLTGKEFEKTPDTLANLEVVLKYFAKDESFKSCSRLITHIDGFSMPLNPSFSKGLLIVGNYGNGKSTILKVFELLFEHNYKIAKEKFWHNIADWEQARFKTANCHDLVTEFESLQNQEAKYNFYKKYTNFRWSFDDLKKEKIASNYGLTNVIQTIFEKRYDNASNFFKVQKNRVLNKPIPKTFGSCNYDDLHPDNLEKALFEFSVKYGGHIYDRVFELSNIVEFKGKSFRN